MRLLWSINVTLRLLKDVNFVVGVDVDVLVVFVFAVVIVVSLNVADVALLVVTGHIIFSCGQ